MENERDALVRAGRELIAASALVSLQRWAAAAGVPEARIKAQLIEAAGREALEHAIGARCVTAEGGYFLVR